MRRHGVLVLAASAAAVWGAGALPAAGTAGAATFSAVSGPPQAASASIATSAAPGVEAASTGGFAEVNSVSCGAAGSCVAGGTSGDSHGHLQGFVAASQDGAWGQPTEVPGLAGLNTGGDAEVLSLSCPSAGNCAAGGVYSHAASQRGFVAVERHGIWASAIEVPGLGLLNRGGYARVVSVSCASAGSCAAGGFYEGRHGQRGFVAVERNGIWASAIEVPGLAALGTGGGGAEVNSVSCGSPGNCATGGDYWDRHGHEQGFVAVERNGRWGTAIEVPGLGALNTGLAQVNSVSCASAASCAAGGSYLGRSGQQGFVALEWHGRWRRAIEVPGLAALNIGGEARVSSVSCPSAGNCVVAGFYRRHHQQGFVASERHGRWRRAIEVPGLQALNRDGYGEVSSVSCPSAGNCAAGGIFDDRQHDYQGFVAGERNGRWSTAVEVPGLGTLNKGGDALVRSVSCAMAGSCAAGGFYLDGACDEHGYVTGERNGRWSTAIEMPGVTVLAAGLPRPRVPDAPPDPGVAAASRRGPSGTALARHVPPLKGERPPS